MVVQVNTANRICPGSRVTYSISGVRGKLLKTPVVGSICCLLDCIDWVDL